MDSLHWIVLFLSPLLITTAASPEPILQVVPESTTFAARSDGRDSSNGIADIYCNSWRLSVETNNAGKWDGVPEICKNSVTEYITGRQYTSDLATVLRNALNFARTVSIAGDGTDIWIFDVEQTLLNCLDFYAKCGTGAFNYTCYDEWVDSMTAPALSSMLNLYKELLRLGFEVVIITGRSEAERSVTETNLKLAGYSSWKALIMEDSTNSGKTKLEFKSTKRADLVAQGYKIHGNTGDQWSDLLGAAMAVRSFKVPNPLYYDA